MALAELRVEDDYVAQMAQNIDETGTYLQQKIDGYLEVLQAIRAEAVMEGETAQALEEFQAYANVLKNRVRVMGEKAKKEAKGFLLEIEEADSFSF